MTDNEWGLAAERAMQSGYIGTIAAEAELRKMFTLSVAKEWIALLSDAERLELFHEYCTNCGSNDPTCQCAFDIDMPSEAEKGE
jgi:hypothetical protein